MGIQIRRTKDGILEAKSIGVTEWHLASTTRRVANNQEFQVKHFLSMTKWQSIYAFKGISMSMLGAGPRSGRGAGSYGSGTGSSNPVYYAGVVFLHFRNLSQAGNAWLVDAQGRTLSGSNIFHGGNLCLGDGLHPLTIQPIDALIYNQANRDLSWQGQQVSGAWRDQSRTSKSKIFEITSWPTIPSLQANPIPPEIVAATEPW